MRDDVVEDGEEWTGRLDEDQVDEVDALSVGAVAEDEPVDEAVEVVLHLVLGHLRHVLVACNVQQA